LFCSHERHPESRFYYYDACQPPAPGFNVGVERSPGYSKDSHAATATDEERGDCQVFTNAQRDPRGLQHRNKHHIQVATSLRTKAVPLTRLLCRAVISCGTGVMRRRILGHSTMRGWNLARERGVLGDEALDNGLV
jgi:hypothetical protein